MHMRWGLAVLIWAMAVSAGAGAAPVGQRLTLAYDLYAASLPAARLDLTLSLTGREYRVTSELRTVGLADMRVGWRAAQHSLGRLIDGEARPRRHSNDGAWRDAPRSVLITYDGARAADVRAEPSAAAEARPPVAAATRAGTVDFMSALVQLAFSESPAAACAGTRHIFDGRRRYDMALVPGPEEMLTPVKVSAFQGPALRCVVSVRRIAGFPAGGDGFEIPEQLFLWLARDARSGLILPVRVQAATEYGTAVIYLTSAAADDGRQARRTD